VGIRVALLFLATGALVAWADPAGLRWAGVVAAAGGLLLGSYALAGVARRRALARTVEGLRQLSPGEFEARVAGWLRREGWQVEHLGGPGDGGMDLRARRGNDVAVVQCKRLAADSSVAAPVVRDLYGAAVAGGATLAVLVTTGRISRAAREWAAGLDQGPRVVLIDAEGVAVAARGGPLVR
jgi:restriction system protein